MNPDCKKFSMLIHEAFDRTLKKQSISAKTLSGLAKVSEAHISQFRNGKGGDVSHTTLERLLAAMDEMAPGAKLYFCLLLAGKNPDRLTMEDSLDPVLLVDSLSGRQVASLLNAIADRFSLTASESNDSASHSAEQVAV